MTTDITIREATPADAAQISAIYAPYVERTAITFEYAPPGIGEMERRIRQTLGSYPYVVACQGTRVVGYAYAGKFRVREAFRMTVETSIYVDSAARGQGAGRLLHNALERALRDMGIQNMNACIAYTPRPGDPHLDNGSMDFHRRMGYRLVAHFRQCGYKFGQWYDIVWMEKIIGTHNGVQPPPLLLSENLEQP